MSYDEKKVDEAALALLYLTTFEQKGVVRAWKGLAWEVSDRLHEQGLIADPRNKTKSIVLTNDGQRRSREAFERLFRKS